MRLYKMVCTELLVLGKNGIVVLYGIVTLLYLFVLSMVPEQSRKIVAVIVIFTDPVTLGLFLMGAIILMERNQRLTDIYSVTPIKIHEYILAKVIPMLIIGMFSSLVLGLYAGCAPPFFCFSRSNAIIIHFFNDWNMYIFSYTFIKSICFVFCTS